MKILKLTLTTICLLFISVNNYGKIKEPKLTQSEVKGKNNVYILKNYEGTAVFYIYNKKNYLIDTETAYLLWSVPPKVSVGNEQEMERLIAKHLTPFFKTYKGNFAKYSNLRVHCYGDPKTGKVNEIYIHYPKELGKISGTVLEQFEKEVLNKIYLTYNKECSIFKESAWIRQYVIYPAETVRNMRINTISGISRDYPER